MGALEEDKERKGEWVKRGEWERESEMRGGKGNVGKW